MLTCLSPTQETIDTVAGLRGKWHGSYAMCRCPAHRDSTPSLSIRQGQHGILVHCFAGCQNEDVLRAISRTRPVFNSPAPKFQPSPSSANARRIWDQGREICETLAEAYLKSRNLPLDLRDIRYHHKCPFGRKPNAVFRPALLVAVRDRLEIMAIQRIALGSKGLCHKGKYMLGRPGMGAWSPSFKGDTLGLADDPLFAVQFDTGKWPQAKARLAEVFASKPRAHWDGLLLGTDVCYAPVLSPSEAAAQPHIAARAIYREIGGVLQTAAAPRFDGETPPDPGPVPESGAHTEEILKEAGLSAAEIAALSSSRAQRSTQ